MPPSLFIAETCEERAGGARSAFRAQEGGMVGNAGKNAERFLAPSFRPLPRPRTLTPSYIPARGPPDVLRHVRDRAGARFPGLDEGGRKSAARGVYKPACALFARQARPSAASTEQLGRACCRPQGR